MSSLTALRDRPLEHAHDWLLLPALVRVKTAGRPALWLPLFLFWPLIVLVFVLALPLCLIFVSPRSSAFAALAASYHVLCALHGTQVEVLDGEHADWSISLY